MSSIDMAPSLFQKVRFTFATKRFPLSLKYCLTYLKYTIYLSHFQKWGVPFDYLLSSGEVYSSHNGTFKKHSNCSVEVMHDRTAFSTYYSHLDITDDIEDGQFIEQGQNIGRIHIDPDQSNCRCDWAAKSFLCATGPHLHIELRHNGAPASLHGKIISNLLIRPGLLPHDMYCSDPDDCTSATFDGKACATTYTHLKTGEVICPVTKGSNIGTQVFFILNI